MKVLRHRLCDDAGNALTFEPTPNRGGQLHAEYLVLHYTAGRDALSSIRWFQNPDAKALFIQASETSTAVTHPVKEIAAFVAQRENTLMIVDAITALCVFDIQTDAWKLDVVIT